MHASLHRVKKITLGKIERLRRGNEADSPIMGYTRHILIDYEDGADLELDCHADEADDLAANID